MGKVVVKKGREETVLNLLEEGFSVEQIAKILGLSIPGVRRYVNILKRKGLITYVGFSRYRVVEEKRRLIQTV